MNTISSGFTLLEVVLVVGILAILGSVGIASYANTARDIQIVSASKHIIEDLRRSRTSAINAEKARAWGLHFIHTATSSYYQVYSTPTNYSDGSMTTEDTIYLTDGVSFTDPASSATKDILFARITGTTTASSVTIASSVESITVHVSALGVVY